MKNFRSSVNIDGELTVNGEPVSATGGGGVPELNAQTGTTYALVISDAGKTVTLDNGAAITLTVPPNSSVAFAIGTRIDLIQVGAGQVTVAEGSGVTVDAKTGLSMEAQWAGATLIKRATDSWVLIGALSATAVEGVLSYIGNVGSTADASSATLSGTPIGAEDASRVVVVTVVARNVGTVTRTVTSATIGGVTATIDSQTSDAFGQVAAVFRLAVPTGTTADIVITFNGTVNRMWCGVYTITGGTVSLVQASGEADASADDSMTVTLGSAESGNLVVAGAGSTDTSAFAWTGVTEDYDVLQEIQFSGGHAVASGPTTVTATGSASQYKALVAAAYAVT